jgi:hypothetical protein
MAAQMPPASEPASADPVAFMQDGGPARRRLRARPGPVALWLSIFTVSLGLFVIRFLVPAPVGQADNHDGPRLMCALGVVPDTGGHTRFFDYAYFEYVSARPCSSPYLSSQLVPLEVARLLTPVLGLPGKLNLIALGLLTCVLVSVGIASLATGLRLPLWGRLAVAAVVWLVMADAAFFDVYASPFSEPAALVGILLVAAGVVHLGRDRRATVAGLSLAGAGGFLAILAKEQYLILVAPVCLTLVLASAPAGARGLRRFASAKTAAAVLVATVLVLLTAGYVAWDSTSQLAARLHREQAIDVIFEDLVPRHDPTTVADLRALGLPDSWARYAGTDAYGASSVLRNPQWQRYQSRLSDATIVKFYLTHPDRILTVGQKAASDAMGLRNPREGDYAPSAGHPPGALENRVAVLTWLMRELPRGTGLYLLVPLWLAMAGLAIAALLVGGGPAWRRDGAVLVLCMTSCSIAAFVPPAFFAGISTTRHMVGMNLATALAVTGSVALGLSMGRQAASRARRGPDPAPATSASALADR